ncbi:glycosyltransferase family 4 protein [Poriferisphaera sp. WC338]|uniref:glycosyltransferase family 4 protein n=1 Tax=Poriferisphaera sp. WC338 TaxID=3425129 RepID=UPI003D8186A2
MSRHVLFVLTHSPFDCASGAAISTRTVAEMLAGQGYEVMVLGVTAVEGAAGAEDHVSEMTQMGVGLAARKIDGVTVYEGRHRGVDYALLKTGGCPTDWMHDTRAADTFEQILVGILSAYQPGAVMTYGGSERGWNWINIIKGSGAAIILLIHNMAYNDASYFEAADLVVVPSQYAANEYNGKLNAECVGLGLPIDRASVVNEASDERVFVTMVNPSVEKGLWVVAQLAEVLGERRPDIPVLIIEGRGTGGMLLEAGRMGGFDLGRHESLMFSGPVSDMREVYGVSRMVLMPSVIAESGGRVAAEAMMNGLPALVSDRGALPEIVGQGGFVLPMPEQVTLKMDRPVECEVVTAWVNLIEKLTDDEVFYTDASRRAAEEAVKFDPAEVCERFVERLEQVLTIPG